MTSAEPTNSAQPATAVDGQSAFDAWVASSDEASMRALTQQWVETTATPIVSYNMDGSVVYLNQACSTLLNRRRRDALPSSMAELFGEEWYDAQQSLVLNSTPENSTVNSQLRFLVDGEEHLYRIDCSVLFTSDETPVNACLLMHDITEDARAREALRQANRSLSESNRDLEEFAYVASHDLQEPLRKIQAFGDRLEARLGDHEDERALDYLERMQNASGRMQILISDLLSFSRVTTAGRELTPVPLDEVVEMVLHDLEVAVTEAGAKIHIGSLPTIDGDRPQLQQLLQNLLGNALKFRAPDKEIEIWIEAVIIGSRWLISIRDTGIGFDQEYAEKIFTVFQRLHGRSSYEGTGVGLAICRKIVERHGGTIRAQSAKGEGATFLIDLPRSLLELQSAA